MPEITSLSYEEGLYKCGILSHEMMRPRSHLIIVHMIVKGFVKVDADKFCQFLDYPLARGHNFRIVKQTCKLNIRKYAFSHRVITEWHNLPPEAVTTKTVNFFEGVIDPLFQQNTWPCICQGRLPAQVFRSY